MDRSRTDEEMRMLETAARALPGGVLGSSRFPDDLAFIVRRGSGSKLYDVSGREYIDYLMGSGPLILGHAHPAATDRKSTRLNSSHSQISYAVFCLKKKKKKR